MEDKIKDKTLAIFENHEIRRAYDEITERWYFSVVDIIRSLEVSIDPRKYWNKLVERLENEGSQVVINYHWFKLVASDGQMRETDVADVETLFRLI